VTVSWGLFSSIGDKGSAGGVDCGVLTLQAVSDASVNEDGIELVFKDDDSPSSGRLVADVLGDTGAMTSASASASDSSTRSLGSAQETARLC